MAGRRTKSAGDMGSAVRSNFERIEICGGIASGKTTLATAFEKHGYNTILEDFHSNPFWRKFYSDPVMYGFETEATFLLQHYSDIKSGRPANRVSICDYSFLQDIAYADINLSKRHFEVFTSIYDRVAKELGRPKLLIHLVCDPYEELRRVRARKRSEESTITLQYLDALNRAILQRTSALRARQRLITIDSGRCDFAHSVDVRNAITRRIMASLR